MSRQEQAITVMMALMSGDYRGEHFIDILAAQCFDHDKERAIAYTQALAAGVG